jgi:hypothetical protein
MCARVPCSIARSHSPATTLSSAKVAIMLQVAMYETRRGFVAAFGVLFQDCTGKNPLVASQRQHPTVLFATTESFIHKIVLAYIFGHWSCHVKSWPQVFGLVRCLGWWRCQQEYCQCCSNFVRSSSCHTYAHDALARLTANMPMV